MSAIEAMMKLTKLFYIKLITYEEDVEKILP